MKLLKILKVKQQLKDFDTIKETYGTSIRQTYEHFLQIERNETKMYKKILQEQSFIIAGYSEGE